MGWGADSELVLPFGGARGPWLQFWNGVRGGMRRYAGLSRADLRKIVSGQQPRCLTNRTCNLLLTQSDSGIDLHGSVGRQLAGE